jgi:hypothetical protein
MSEKCQVGAGSRSEEEVNHADRESLGPWAGRVNKVKPQILWRIIEWCAVGLSLLLGVLRAAVMKMLSNY